MTTPDRLSIKARAEARVCICVRNDGMLVLSISDQAGKYRLVGEPEDVGGAIIGWMVGKHLNEE